MSIPEFKVELKAESKVKPHSARVVRIQPPSTPPMHATKGGNRNALGIKTTARGEREWSYDLTDCPGDCGTCCFACGCPSIVYSRNKSRLEHLEETGEPHPNGGVSFSLDGLYHFMTCLVCCNCLLQSKMRSKVRSRYRINTIGSDCCTGLCCTSCQLTQESRELELEEQSLRKI